MSEGKEKEVKCPECEITLPEGNFIVMMFLTGNNDYWCPECGYEWKETP
jgi:DNA-directed RNA polymerase subunit RPC12/RpoP